MLFQLPELVILAVLAAPTLMARIALAYPRVQDVPDPRDTGAGGSDSGSDPSEAGGGQPQGPHSSGPDSV